MSSALAGENLSGAQGSQTSCIFIIGHREFSEQEINTSSLFMAGAGVESGAGSWLQLGLKTPSEFASTGQGSHTPLP